MQLGKERAEYGLVKSGVAGLLAEQIDYNEDGVRYFDKEHKLGDLPSSADSEAWGLPPS